MNDNVRKIFYMLGVEPNEEFRIKKDDNTFLDGIFKIDKDLRIWQVLIGGIVSDYLENVSNILCGYYKIVKIPKPTKLEKQAIDFYKQNGCSWIAKNGFIGEGIQAFKQKPEKVLRHGLWVSKYSSFRLPCDISFISWEDEEPYYIGD